MSKYTSFFLSQVAQQLTEDDLYNLNSMPCEAKDLIAPVDRCIRLRLVTTGKKYVFFGPTVYRKTDLAAAVSEHIFGY